jgi:hypothetical protein
MTSNTTSSEFQVYPDFFTDKEQAISFKYLEKKQTNSRYRNFNQTHFTAGDEEQFQRYKLSKMMSGNENLSPSEDIWEKYKDIDGSSILNTFRYIFYKFKKGLFVKIMNNELKVFLPFSNANFINEWSSNIDTSDMEHIFKYVCEKENRKYNERNVNRNHNTWYCNNYLLRYEYPINEGDTNVCVLKNMLEELCKKRNVPDVEFFINRRDFPLHTRNCSEPYFDIWNSDKKKLQSHEYDKYCPILSMSKSNLFEDILIPTHEDWARVQSLENIYFPNTRISNIEKETDWSNKKPIAVFRGSSTGRGVTIETNQRLKISYMSSLNLIDKKDNLPYLDAGITKWNLRPRKLSGSRKLQTIKIESLPFKLLPYMTLEEQSQYKYIVHIDGHVSAFRLSSELSTNSLLLIVESEWKVWYSNKLKPYEHYIPIKRDLSDLISKIEWCKSNDEKCENISRNAYDFFNSYLQKDSILDFFQSTIINIKRNIGDYYYFDIDYKEIKSRIEKEYITKHLNDSKRKPSKIDLDSIEIHNQRFHGLLRSIQVLFLTYKDSRKFSKKFTLDKIIYKNKNTVISKYTINNYSICLKEINFNNEKENIHEAFVGISCINEILKEIPNFYYTFDFMYEGKYIVNEYIPNSITLFEYIKSESFKFNDYLYIILQLCLSLHISQVKCNFVHYDLTPWNVLLQFLDEEETIDYKIDINKVVTIKTKIIPIIIDYGKSYVSFENKHHGFIKLFKFSKSQDIISILLTSVYEIIMHKNLDHVEFQNLLKLSNFLSGTTYRREKFRNSKELKKFTIIHKKYSSLIGSNKYELENRTPLDLYYYILKFISSDFKMDEACSDKFKPYMLKFNYDMYYKLFFMKKKITVSDFMNSIKSYMDEDCKINELNCIIGNLKTFINDDVIVNKMNRKFYKEIGFIKESVDEKENLIVINPLSISYDESDLLSITQLKMISDKIKFEKEKNHNNHARCNFYSLVNYMNNLTTINDFNSIIEKLITNNPYIKNKFIELL